jgi:PAS domain-containing protein
MMDWASVLTSALDEVGYGILLLDSDLQARFINRAYYRIWGLPPSPLDTTYSFPDLMAHGRKTGKSRLRRWMTMSASASLRFAAAASRRCSCG